MCRAGVLQDRFGKHWSSHLFLHLSVSSKTCICSDSSSPVINKKKESSKE